MAKQIKVKQVKSGIGRPKDQKETLQGLGLRKLNQTVLRVDSPQIRGMIQKVGHLVEWEEVKNG